MEVPPLVEDLQPAPRARIVNRVSEFIASRQIWLTVLLWLIYPIYSSAKSPDPFSAKSFFLYLIEPLAFVPGILGYLFGLQGYLHDQIRRISDDVTALRGDVASLRVKDLSSLSAEIGKAAAFRDAAELQAIYAGLMHWKDDKRKGPIARIAKDIFAKAMLDLKRLQVDETIVLEIRSRPKKYNEQWISAFDQIVTAANKTGCFMTVTNMVIWKEDNMGFTSTGHSEYHLSQVRSSVEKRYYVQRVFVMPPTEQMVGHPALLKRYLQVLEFYSRVIKNADQRATEAGGMNRPQYESKVYVAETVEEYERHFGPKQASRDHGSGNFALWGVRSESEQVDPIVANLVKYQNDLKPTRSGENELERIEAYPIDTISFTWDAAIVKEKHDEFIWYWQKSGAKSLDAYMDFLKQEVAKIDGGSPRDTHVAKSPA